MSWTKELSVLRNKALDFKCDILQLKSAILQYTVLRVLQQRRKHHSSGSSGFVRVVVLYSCTLFSE